MEQRMLLQKTTTGYHTLNKKLKEILIRMHVDGESRKDNMGGKNSITPKRLLMCLGM